ncbi:MAG: hypothetical protein ABIJ57_08480 [Pseudomonadota bacterium]
MRTPLDTFRNMKSRCYSPKARKYSSYGGNGITICDKWLRNPVSFATWAENNGYAPGMQIHRIEGSKVYSPDTCIFVNIEKHRSLHQKQYKEFESKPLKTIKQTECKKCGHAWFPRVKEPVQCPRCKSLSWKYPKARKAA